MSDAKAISEQGWTDVIARKDGPVGWVVLNRPDKANSIRPRTFSELDAAFSLLERDDEIGAIVFTGAGEKLFSAGIDMADEHRATSSREWDEQTRLSAGVCQRIWYLDKPVISAVRGHAVAYGCLLAMICDLTIAAEDAQFSEPEIRHGTLTPMMLLPWLTHMKALHEFYYTGDAISARQAKELGLVNRVVPADRLLAEAERMARRISNAPKYSVTLAKRALRQNYDIMGFRGAQSAHRYIDTYLLDSHGDPHKEGLRRVFREEGLRAWIEKRDGPYRDK